MWMILLADDWKDEIFFLISDWYRQMDLGFVDSEWMIAGVHKMQQAGIINEGEAGMLPRLQLSTKTSLILQLSWSSSALVPIFYWLAQTKLIIRQPDTYLHTRSRGREHGINWFARSFMGICLLDIMGQKMWSILVIVTQASKFWPFSHDCRMNL